MRGGDEAKTLVVKTNYVEGRENTINVELVTTTKIIFNDNK